MQLTDLYPYWQDTHDQLIDALSYWPEERWGDRPAHRAGRSIRQSVLYLIRLERFLILHLCLGVEDWEQPSADYATKAQLIEALEANRLTTLEYVATLQPEGLRAVRTIPFDPEDNFPETNQPVSWILWRLIQQESFCWGQIALRMKD